MSEIRGNETICHKTVVVPATQSQVFTISNGAPTAWIQFFCDSGRIWVNMNETWTGKGKELPTHSATMSIYEGVSVYGGVPSALYPAGINGFSALASGANPISMSYTYGIRRETNFGF
jgi:hypothetical protein